MGHRVTGLCEVVLALSVAITRRDKRFLTDGFEAKSPDGEV